MPVISEQILSDICESRQKKKPWRQKQAIKDDTSKRTGGVCESHYWRCTKLQYGRLFYKLLQTVLITACCYKRAGVNLFNYQIQ